MEVPHTQFSEVSRMVFVEVDSVVVHTTSITTTSRMFPVFTNTTVSMTHVSPKFTCFTGSGWHFGGSLRNYKWNTQDFQATRFNTDEYHQPPSGCTSGNIVVLDCRLCVSIFLISYFVDSVGVSGEE